MSSSPIFLFIPTSRSGVARYAFELAAALHREHGGDAVRPAVVCPTDFEFADALRGAGVHCLSICPIGAGGSLKKLLNMLRQIVRVITYVKDAKTGGTARIHIVANYVAPLQLMLHVGLRLLGGSLLLTVHDVTPHHQSAYGVIRRGGRFLWRLSYSLATSLHVHTQNQKDELERDYGVRGSKIWIIPHGLDLRSDGARVDRPAGPVRLLVIGSIRSNKRILETIRAAEELTQEWPNSLELEIYGAGSRSESGYLSQVRELSAACRHCVAFHEGFLPEQQFDQLLRTFDAVLLPYADFNSQSGILLRAVANGCFIIATTSAAGEVPVFSALGIRVEDGASQRDIAAALRQFVALDVGDRTRRATALRELMQGQISWDVVAHSFSGWYTRASQS